MKDIQNRKDIELLVDAFYKRIIVDDVIGFFFTKVIELDWDKHIPIMYDFWETILLGNIKYKGNPMLKHIDLNKKAALKPEHFARWLELWQITLSENFSGKNADEALNRAKQIGALMEFKVGQDTSKNN